MTNNIYNPLSEKTQSQMFFGDGHFVQEFLELDYPWALKSADRQNSQDWSFDEFNLKLDAQQLSSANNAVRHIFTTNLQSQIFADTIQGRGPSWLIPYVSDPSLEYAFTQWARFECFTEDHQILTVDGWIPIKEVSLLSKVAQYNKDTQEISFVNPTNLVIKEYDGDMYHFSNDTCHVDQFVTENHRMPKINRYGICSDILAKDLNTSSSFSLPLSGLKKSEKRLSDLERLFIAVQFSGSVASSKYTGERTGTIQYKFKLKNQIKINNLKLLAEKLNYDYTEYSLTEEDFKTITILVPKELYRRDIKTFDWIKLEDIGSEWILDFFNELVKWTGQHCPNDSFKFNSTNKDLIDFLATLAHLSNHRSIIHTRPSKSRLFPNGKNVILKESYQISITKNNKLSYTSIDKNKEHFKGLVYCISVPDSYLLIRRNGVISVSGNCLHSRTYTHILTSMYSNPRIVLEMIEQKPEIFARFSMAIEKYNTFFDEPNEKNLVLLIAAINILEGLSFYSSFICNFSFAKQGLFESVSKFLQLIARDEALHLGLTQQIIKTWSSGRDGPKWKKLWEESKDEVRDMYIRGIEEEFVFSKYLFQYGTPIVGLNEEILNQCNIYYGNKRMRNIGLKPYNTLTKDPLPWVQTKYLSTSSVQDAPQEVSLNTYLKDSVVPLKDSANISKLFDKVFKQYEVIT